jgi:hypothetical protein
VVVVLVFGSGLIGCRHGLEHTFDQPLGRDTPAGLGALVAELQGLAAQDPDRLGDGARAERVLVLRGLVERLEGQWLAELAAVDARGAAGADHGVQAGSTPPGSATGCA